MQFRIAILFLFSCLPMSPAVSPAEYEIRIPHHPDSSIGTSSGFSLTTPDHTGITFSNRLAEERFRGNQILLNGSGVAAGDVDGDGKVDLYFCGLDSPNALYLNQGDWKFRDEAEARGVACRETDSTSAAFADMDGDGDLDLLVGTIGQGTRLFSNNGTGMFQDVTEPARFTSGKANMSMAIADFNADGFLDLYVANYRTETFRDRPFTKFRVQTVDGGPVVVAVDGQPTSTPPLLGRYSISSTGQIEEHGEEDDFYLNNRNGSFTRVPFTGGYFKDESGSRLSSPPLDWGLSVMARDINRDGLPDLYVCNDFDSEDRIWINTGRGFQSIDTLAVRHTSMYSMGIDFADIDRDGDDDFLVADMLSRDHRRRTVQVAETRLRMNPPGEIANRPQYMRNTLMLNRGDATFADIALFAGLDATEWTWSVAFIDVDFDGFEDLLTTNGHERDALNVDAANAIAAARRGSKMSRGEILDLRVLYPRLATGNLAFRNQGDRTFKDLSDDWGFHLTGVSHGMAMADLDNDGDLDVAINNLNAECSVYRNIATAPRIAVRLHGAGANTRGIGARIHVETGDLLQSQEMTLGGRYLSSDDSMRAFAAPGGGPFSVRIDWPSGRTSAFNNALPNRIYEFVEAEATSKPTGAAKPATAPAPLFADRSGLLGHTHRQPMIDDFQSEALLPFKPSRSGPPAVAHDFDNDTWPDVLIGEASDSPPSVYWNQQGIGFRAASLPNLPGSHGPLTAVAPYPTTEGDSLVWMAFGSTSGAADAVSILVLYDIQTEAPLFTQMLSGIDIGALAVVSLNGKGEQALIAGPRRIPGRYGAPADTLVYRQTGTNWSVDTRLSHSFRAVGMVASMEAADLNGDSLEDVIVATSWGPVRVFQNRGARFEEATRSLGLSPIRGLWNDLAAGDFNDDGRIDFAATNTGRNSEYASFGSRTIRLHFGPLGGQNGHDVLESRLLDRTRTWVPIRRFDTLSASLPWLRARFPTFASFGAATTDEILALAPGPCETLEVNTFDSGAFINRGDRFDFVPFPDEAQFSPAFGCAVADFDGDGVSDVFLAQNLFATRPETARLDAGQGLLLSGIGDGSFIPVPSSTSGIRIHGEQRAATVADFDRNGVPDLLVTQNGAKTRLLLNKQHAGN